MPDECDRLPGCGSRAEQLSMANSERLTELANHLGLALGRGHKVDGQYHLPLEFKEKIKPKELPEGVTWQLAELPDGFAEARDKLRGPHRR